LNLILYKKHIQNVLNENKKIKNGRP